MKSRVLKNFLGLLSLALMGLGCTVGNHWLALTLGFLSGSIMWFITCC